ncbi:MAG: glycine oxidase ThiO [Deltaproteobacteria bacterium]|nr:glycine oxidase ThiO [Deltaproteobacteria bacterium]
MVETADVVVVGGGIIGCAIAYYLAREKVRTVVIDKGQPGHEASSAAGGFLAVASGSQRRGPTFELKRASLALYEPLVQELKEQTGIDSEYLRYGLLELIRSDEDGERLRALYNLRREQGLPAEWLSAEDVWKLEPKLTREIRGAAFFPGDPHLNNTKLTQTLAVGAQKLGVEFLAGRAVTEIKKEGSRVVAVSAEGEEVKGEKVIIAAGSWSGKVGKLFGLTIPVEPAKGQMMTCRADFLHHLVSWGDHYLVPRLNGEVLIGATVEFVGFNKEVTLEAVRDFLEKTAEIMPALVKRPLGRAWAGLRPYSATGRPIIGPAPGLDNVILATGHFRDGILLAPITGKLIAELITSGTPSLSLEPFGLSVSGAGADEE